MSNHHQTTTPLLSRSDRRRSVSVRIGREPEELFNHYQGLTTN